MRFVNMVVRFHLFNLFSVQVKWTVRDINIITLAIARIKIETFKAIIFFAFH